MKRLVKMNRVVALTLAFVMAMYALAPLSVAAATKANAAPAAKAAQGAFIPIVDTGIFDSITNPALAGLAGSFAGIFNVTDFVVQDGVLKAVGTLTGTVRNAAGAIVGTVNNLPLTLPVIGGGSGGSAGTCEILDLQLGPLDLNLLGLRIQLSQVDLVITAISGPGNLLGNLLCAVVGLLDGGLNLGNLTDLAGLLNKILKKL
jgi:hypothetical protein